MTYAIHASRNGQDAVTIRINPVAAVDKARLLNVSVGELMLPTQLGTNSVHPTIIYCLIKRQLKSP